MPDSKQISQIAIVGAGPGGLMAAEVLAQDPRLTVTVYEAMPSPGRKFLQAGRGGLNLTHSEPFADFVRRYAARQPQIEPWLREFGPAQIRDWVRGLGMDTFVGSSGRVYPLDMKAAPLLRAWLHRLREQGVQFAMHHRWQGWSEDGQLRFENREGIVKIKADAVILALGGASWPHLGSNGAWTAFFNTEDLAAFQPANCGFDQAWSDLFKQKFAGQPLKSVVLKVVDHRQQHWQKKGELLITEHGLEGGLIYALSAPIRDSLLAEGKVEATVDLLPDRTVDELLAKLNKPRGKNSWSKHVKRAGIDALRAHLLRERLTQEQIYDWAAVAALLKRYPLQLSAPRPIAEAISSAGGVRFEALNDKGMLRRRPGVFCVGEMLDWEAPTGGYLLSAILANARVCAQGVRDWLTSRPAP